MKNPEIVVFDLGKVLVDFDYSIASRRIAQRGTIAPEDVQHFIDHSPLLYRYETGLIDQQQFFDEVRQIAGFRGDREVRIHLVTQFSIRVQVPSSRCRSDSIAPRLATGSQRSEAGRNGGAWQPRAGYPVQQASRGSVSKGALSHREGEPAQEADALEPKGTGYGAGNLGD